MKKIKNQLIYILNKERIKKELDSCGITEKDAEIIAECFTVADIYGVNTHGSSVLQAHLERIIKGGYNLKPNFKVVRETSSFAVIDGDNAIGPVSAVFCMNYAIEKAHANGMFTVFSRNNNTFGPAFYYPLLAAEQGYIGIVSSNSPAQMAPCGGVEKMLGTNPFSIVIPVPGKEPIIIDMASSIVAKSKFKEYANRNEQLPAGWALNCKGEATTDPNEAINGLILPMAGFKGYSIALLIDVLAGVLSGSAFLNHVGKFYSDDKNSMNVGYVISAIDPKQVLGEEYDVIINEYVAELRSSKSCSNGKVAIPGDDRIAFKNSIIKEV